MGSARCRGVPTPPDLILLDWMMPKLSGLDVLRAVREHSMQHPAVIMCTARDEASSIAKRLKRRERHIQKPINMRSSSPASRLSSSVAPRCRL